MKAERACQLAADVQPENMGVISFVIRVDERLRGVRRNRNFTSISLIAKSPDRFTLCLAIGAPIVHAGYEPGNPTEKIIFTFPAIGKTPRRCLLNRCLIFEHGPSAFAQ